ncbi:FAD synthase [Candidatus Woesearchaeota archaeon CG10_big_fil_rev_8_21_14_0_10_34_12]|nr:MAG: FAD synthase [Candidatus Woesearchaeota archaeon CG10_big_fil_rev_8_21_14_0_10_34_12]
MIKVLTSGTWDILHEGHIEFLKDAKKQGDFLIVMVMSDHAVYRKKGKLPLFKQKTRAIKLRQLGIADQIIASPENCDNNLELIVNIKPEVIALGYDQKDKKVEEIKKYLFSRGQFPTYYRSKEFANGIHSSHLRNKVTLEKSI